jgi:hypothetical protein
LLIDKIAPDNGTTLGGTRIQVCGTGFFDSKDKQCKMILPDGDQYILDLKWAKKEQQFSILIPPITWLFGDNEPTPDDIKNVM